MSKTGFAVVFWIMLHTLTFSQGINNNWLMGYASWGGLPFGQTKMDFYNGSPTILYDSIEMDFRHTHANISDTAGNLLFYTNGYYIADATNDTMLNGSGLNPGAYSAMAMDGLAIPQGALIIQKPLSGNLFYLFHSSYDNYPQSNYAAFQLYKTEIDMNLNGGLGAVTIKNIPVITDTLNTCKITGVKHANGIDWWVIVHRLNSNKFYTLLITPSGIQGPYSQNIGIVRSSDAGQAWFSPDGKKYAYYYVNGGLEVFDFDRCTGLLSNPQWVNIPFAGGINVGMAISASSNALYVSNSDSLMQFDLTSANIASTQQTVAVFDSFQCTYPGFSPITTFFGLGALAPDGKIYFTTGSSTFYLHTIDNPDVIGIGCNVNQHSVQIAGYSFNTLPNHPNYFLGCDTTGGCICLVNTNTIESNNINARAAPNPTTGVFTFQFPVFNTRGELIIYDVTGSIVHKEYIAPWSQYKKVNITTLPTGLYLCKLNWKNGNASVKIIKE